MQRLLSSCSEISCKAFFCAAAMLCAAITPLTVHADTLGKDFGLIDQIVSVGFEPVTLFVLQQTAEGEIRQYRAAALPLPASGNIPSSEHELLLAAPVLITEKNLRDPSFHFTFFMASKDAAFAATVVKKWTLEELRQNSLQPSQMREEIEQLDQRLKILRVEVLNLDEKLADLRSRASQIAPIDEIIDLQMNLEGIDRTKKKKDEEILRIHELVESGRKLQDPENVDTLRQELALHLAEAAKVTALADRLDRRRQDAALQTFMNKVNLVKEMQSANPEALAQEVLRLRKKRRELEARVGVGSNDATNDDF